jgi:predicted ATPase with chaperone activity
MIASGLALPARRITINLAPADLPIALGMMAAIGAIPHDALSGFAVLGELGLDGSIAQVAGGVAGRHRRQRPRRGVDLSGEMRPGSGMGEPRGRDHRAVLADFS